VLLNNCFRSIAPFIVCGVGSAAIIWEVASCETHPIDNITKEFVVIQFFNTAQFRPTPPSRDDGNLIDKAKVISWACANISNEISLQSHS
jgi:hypothetical protein